ncbi:MAG TPA: primosomal protein N' [Nocardioidaceae bacterium]|nr:primosomal protein N' [Nocardioidaceae bacterium]
MSPAEPTTGGQQHEQLALARDRVRRTPTSRPPGPAAEQPVARVLVDVALAHLDRPFDYLVNDDIAAQARPGCRVKVRFAGKELGGYILERAESSDHTGRLTPLRRLVSPMPVLTPQVSRLCREVAERYAGVTSDVLRLAVPPRHARVEREFEAPAADQSPPAVSAAASAEWSGQWDGYPAGPAYLERLRGGRAPRAVWTALPGPGWVEALGDAVLATLDGGRGSLVCLPDQRDVRRLAEALRTRLGTRLGGREGGADEVAVVTADLGPSARYRAFLRVLTGMSRVVVGTRSAAFAPVHDLGLVAIWDDGDDLHAEPRAPYPHAREVLAARAHLEGTGLLVGGFARTAEAEHLVESGWAHPLVAPRGAVRAAAPRIHVTGETESELDRDPVARRARLPHRALTVARSALESGPVLVQVPRAGYLAALACVRCRQPARCEHCQGPLTLAQGQRFAGCRWCGQAATRWQCGHCGADRFRAPVVGSQRTAEELGRTFPKVPVVSSVGGQVRDRVDGRPALVVATPGAEPPAEGGYAAALVLDTWLTLARPDLRTSEEALRRWLGAAALVRPAAEGGSVVVVGDPAAAPVQSLVRWDPAGAAERELADRTATRLPPVARVATVTGPADALDELVRGLDLPAGAETLGPVPVDEDSARVIVRVPYAVGGGLSQALRQGQAARSARKLTHLRVQVDPTELG